jgi:prolyl-tRNA synthetase
MRQSRLFTKTQKFAPKDEASLNAQLLMRAGYADKLMAGVYSLLPLGWRVFKKAEQIVREEMNNIGGLEMFMPSLTPVENYEKTGRFEVLMNDILFQAEALHVKDVVLNMSHEEVITPLMGKFAQSYKDFPRYVYQFQNKFRGEARPKAGLMRGREFIMKDLYSFHTSEEDLEMFYEQARRAYIKIFERCGIGNITYYTYASGGTFSKYSHEFQTLTEAGEDIIYICEACRLAINKEIIKDLDNKCPECGNAELVKKKSVEVGNIFKLGTKFSVPFDFSFVDENNIKHPVIMGCYGIGLQRLIGTVVETSHDDKGIIWPESLAPFRIHLISVDKKQNLDVKKTADDIYEKMLKEGKEVLYDDRDCGAGEKFADADLIGIPYRIVVSEKTLAMDSVEMKKRGEEGVEMVGIGDINY